MATAILPLHIERGELTLDILRADRDYTLTYRDAAAIAADELIASLAYALDWDARAAAQRQAAEAPRPRTSRDKARDKAAWHLANGLRIARDRNGDYLVPSGTRGGVIHRIHHGVCSCEAGQKNTLCWHLEAVQQAEEPRRAA